MQILLYVYTSAAIVIYQFMRKVTLQNRKSSKCVSYPHLELFLGLDLLIVTMWRMITHTHIVAVAERHRKYGSTFSINQFGNKTFHTIDPQNIRAVFGTASRDWHVEPARLQAMAPLCIIYKHYVCCWF